VPNYSMNDPEYWGCAGKKIRDARGRPREENGRKATFRLLGPDEDSTPLIAILDMPPGYVIFAATRTTASASRWSSKDRSTSATGCSTRVT